MDEDSQKHGKGLLRVGYSFLGHLAANMLAPEELARLLGLPRGVTIGGHQEEDPLGAPERVAVLLLRGPGLPPCADGERVPLVDGRVVHRQDDTFAWEFSPMEDAGASVL